MPPGDNNKTRRRYRGYVARNCLDKHTFHEDEGPKTTAQLLEVTKTEASVLAGKMRQKQIPMKLEHEENVVSLGRVVNAWLENFDQDLVAEFELDVEDNGSAKLTENLITSNKMNELSLTHFPKTLEPVELSLCYEGAREGTKITDQFFAVSASNKTLNSGVYKIIHNKDVCIQAISASLSNMSLGANSAVAVRNTGDPNNVSYHSNLAGSDDISRLMNTVLPPNGAHPLSSPVEEDRKRREYDLANQVRMMQEEQRQLKQQLLMQQQQQQQQQQQFLPPQALSQPQPTSASFAQSPPAPLPPQQQQPQQPEQTPPAPQQQQAPQAPLDARTRLQLAAQSIYQPHKGIPTAEEKAQILETLKEQLVITDQNKALAEELAALKKHKEDSEKRMMHEQKKKIDDLVNTYTTLLTKTPNINPEQVEKMKQEALQGNLSSMYQTAMDTAVSASQQDMQKSFLASKAVEQKAYEAFNQQFLNQQVSTTGNTSSSGYVPPVSASNNYMYNSVQQPYVDTNTHLANESYNPVQREYQDNQMIKATAAYHSKFNSHYSSGSYTPANEIWKKAPYNPNSHVAHVLSKQYPGQSLETWSHQSVLDEANKQAMLF